MVTSDSNAAKNLFKSAISRFDCGAGDTAAVVCLRPVFAPAERYR